MSNGDMEEFEQMVRETCPEKEGGEDVGERYVKKLEFCQEVPILASHKREVRILCKAGLVMLFVDEIPIILEQGRDLWCSGVVKAHGIHPGETVICYRIFT